MKTVPLHGGKAAGRVALVDDEDYDMVAQYRWNVSEVVKRGRTNGPYATTRLPARTDSRRPTLQMHVLIMGARGVDHIDHDGLNNQRSNLRLANQTQNGRNQRPQEGKTSAYKGVYWQAEARKWCASIRINKKLVFIGGFLSELEAAYAYDTRAREAFGEFACPNFPDGPTSDMVAQWRVVSAEWEAGRGRRRSEASSRRAACRQPTACTCEECGNGYFSVQPAQSRFCSSACAGKARRRRMREAQSLTPDLGRGNAGWTEVWTRRKPETRTCEICGGEYQTKVMRSTKYCSDPCRKKARIRRRRDERELRESTPRVGTCKVCGAEYTFRSRGPSYYCSGKCTAKASRARKKAAVA